MSSWYTAIKILMAGIALSGHVAIGTILINRLHSTGLPHWMIKVIDALWVFWHALIPVIWLAWVYDVNDDWNSWPMVRPLVYGHLLICAGAAVSLIPGWLQRRVTRQTTELQRSEKTRVVDMVSELGKIPATSPVVRFLARIPANEIMQLHVNEKSLVIPRLDKRLDGLSITHLSDVHFTGDISEDFHHEVMRQANELDSDIIAVTGDLIDKRKCMNWLGTILGRLQARHGVYFVLGNHDVRVHNEFGVRDALTTAGLNDLGRRSLQIDVNDCPIVLAGNELPWFVPAADMSERPFSENSPLRILLSHAPDQIPWAVSNHFDLMLAGHTHGGQVQFPIVGPVLSPSRFGVRYASGSFYEPPTVMHVSRGISGTRHLRINAPPELTKLVLRAEEKTH